MKTDFPSNTTWKGPNVLMLKLSPPHWQRNDIALVPIQVALPALPRQGCGPGRFVDRKTRWHGHKGTEALLDAPFSLHFLPQCRHTGHEASSSELMLGSGTMAKCLINKFVKRLKTTEHNPKQAKYQNPAAQAPTSVHSNWTTVWPESKTSQCSNQTLVLSTLAERMQRFTLQQHMGLERTDMQDLTSINLFLNRTASVRPKKKLGPDTS